MFLCDRNDPAFDAIALLLPPAQYPSIFDPVQLDAPELLAVGDWNDDGHLDLVTVASEMNLTQDLVYLPGDGTGRFGSLRSIDNEPYQFLDIAPADLNGDGKTDLVVSQSTVYSVYLGSGGGVVVLSDYPAGMPFADVGSIAIGDVDGDGQLDVSGVDRKFGQLSIARGTGTGALEPPMLCALDGQPTDWGDVAVGRFAGGKGGVALASVTNHVTVFLRK